MKKNHLFVYAVLFSNVALSNNEKLDKVYLSISNEEYNKAVLIISEEYDYDIREGYRDVAIIMSRNNKDKKKSHVIEKFLEKGCKGYSDVTCLTYGLSLEYKNKFDEAEKVYIDIERKNKDASSMERLYYLYKNKNWNRYDLEKSKFWEKKYISKMKENDKKRKLILKKYGISGVRVNLPQFIGRFNCRMKNTL